MIDHVVLNVTDIARARAFYDSALRAVGYGLEMEFENMLGYGPEGRPVFWLAQRAPVSSGTHVAIQCKSRSAVDAFHAAGLDAGGTDHGAPGVRAHYHPNYYGAFVLDPDGNNIEAVCHTPAGDAIHES